MRLRRQLNLPVAALLAVLILCGCGLQPKTFDVATRDVSVTATVHQPTTIAARLRRMAPGQRAALLRWWRLIAIEAYLHAVWEAVYGIPAWLQPVARCIKGVESGDYTESSHPSSGSGAYQMVPGTFRYYFTGWAIATHYAGPAYQYAYEAPWYVQDAVLVWMLTHGGASNYSGVDSCTAGIPGLTGRHPGYNGLHGEDVALHHTRPDGPHRRAHRSRRLPDPRRRDRRPARRGHYRASPNVSRSRRPHPRQRVNRRR